MRIFDEGYYAQVTIERMYDDFIFYGVVIVAAVITAVVLETYMGRRRKTRRRAS